MTDILGPEFGFIDSLRDTELTLRDLLSHRTGLARLDFALLTREGLPRVDLVKYEIYLIYYNAPICLASGWFA